MYCKKCGAEVDVNTKQCPSCGSTVAFDDVENKKRTFKKKKGVATVICIVLIAISTCFAVFWGFFRERSIETTLKQAFDTAMNSGLYSTKKYMAPDMLKLYSEYKGYYVSEEFADEIIPPNAKIVGYQILDIEEMDLSRDLQINNTVGSFSSAMHGTSIETEFMFKENELLESGLFTAKGVATIKIKLEKECVSLTTNAVYIALYRSGNKWYLDPDFFQDIFRGVETFR